MKEVKLGTEDEIFKLIQTWYKLIQRVGAFDSPVGTDAEWDMATKIFSEFTKTASDDSRAFACHLGVAWLTHLQELENKAKGINKGDWWEAVRRDADK